jgi:hypothetical protein
MFPAMSSMLHMTLLLKDVARIFLRFVLALLIAGTLASAVWVCDVWMKGQTVPRALRGEVEDSLGTLDGLLRLAFLVGSPVGLLWGLIAWRRNSSSKALPEGSAEP